MAKSLTCRKVNRSKGKVYVRWSDKTEQEFASEDEMRQWLDATLTDDVLRAMLMTKWLHNPSGNPNLIEGKTVTLDTAHPSNVVRLS